MPHDGAPFFVMELVKGIPLTEFCDTHRLTVYDRLTLFQQICGAVQHAHQKGIIHRDLKPGNILVESHDGKAVPKVIDFGLAKATSGLQLTENTLFTGFGSVLGTPLYMAPEQATFNAVDVDTRADVYALGVILYELLTGTTPLTRETMRNVLLDEMLKLIREQEAPTPSSRLSSSESKPTVAANRQTEPAKLGRFVKGELDWIVLKALSKDRDRRYETANGFAADIGRFLNHEPVVAGPPSRSYRLRKFVRRNRPQVIAAGVVLFALVAGIVGTTLGLLEAQRQEGYAREEAELKEKARAEEARQRAIAEANERTASAAKEAEARERAVAEAEKKRSIAFKNKTLDALRATTVTDVELLLGERSDLSANEKSYLEAIAKRWRLFAEQEGTDEQSRAIRGEGHGRVALLWLKLGRLHEARPECEKAVAILTKLAADFPAVPAYRLDLADSHFNLGAFHSRLGQRTEAEEQQRKAMAILERLVAEFPDSSQYRAELARIHYGLGILLNGVGQQDGAEEQFKASLAIRELLVIDFPVSHKFRSELARSHISLGVVLNSLGQREGAEEQYRKGLAIHEKLTAEGLTPAAYRSEQARGHNNLGNLLVHMGKPSEAEEQYRKGIALQEKMAADFPVVPEYRGALALSHNNLGRLLAGQNRRAEAEQQYRKGIALQEKTATDFPAVPEYRARLATSLNNLGNLLADVGQSAGSEQQYRKALAIQEKLAIDFPDVPKYRVELGGSCCNVGRLMSDGGDSTGSLKWFGRAIDGLHDVLRKEPRDIVAKQFLRNSHGARAVAHDRLQKFAEAVKDWDRAIALSPPADQRFLRASRATSQLNAGLVAKAVAEVVELTKSPNWSAVQWYDFACVYAVASGKIADKKAEYTDRAMELLQKAVKAGYRNAAHLKADKNLDTLRERDDFKKLLADLAKKYPPTRELAPPPKAVK